MAVYLLTVSAAGFGSWAGYEGYTEKPVIPVRATCRPSAMAVRGMRAGAP